MTTAQEIAALRTRLLSKEEVARFTALNPMRACFDIARHWFLIAASWALVAYAPSVVTIALAIIVVGTRANALLIIAHDGLHRRVAKSVTLNDRITNLCILSAVGAVTRLHRTNHIEHHLKLCTEDDPDRTNYAHATRPDRIHFLLFFTGALTILKQIRNIFLGGGQESPQPASEGFAFGDLAAIALWQAVLIGGLTYFIGWWAFPVLWVLPLFLFYFITDMARQFAEHSELMPDEEADARGRLITFESNGLERLIFSPHNMNYHAVHHLWPAIPYYHLPKANRLVQERATAMATPLKWRGSYFNYFADYFRAMPF